MSDSESLPLAAIRYPRGFDVDELLLSSCAEVRSHGFRIGGIIQRSSGDRSECASSICVVDLRSGQMFDIWEERGPGARSCRLDERSLVDIEPTIMSAIADGVDLIVVNRFGRAESCGRGLISCFMAAIEAGVPVLTAVRSPYEEAWHLFHGGLGQELPPEMEAVISWSTRAARGSPGVRATQLPLIVAA